MNDADRDSIRQVLESTKIALAAFAPAIRGRHFVAGIGKDRRNLHFLIGQAEYALKELIAQAEDHL